MVPMKDVVNDMKSKMVKTSDLGWFPTDHLSNAAPVMEESSITATITVISAYN